jgi:5-methylthioribose kinase
MANYIDRARESVRNHFAALMSDEVKKCVQAARLNLFYGPLGSAYLTENDLPDLSFSEAVEKVADWWREQDHEVWVDTQCDEVLTKCPEGYTDDETGEFVEVCWEDYIVFDGRELKRAVFGDLAHELANYI